MALMSWLPRDRDQLQSQSSWEICLPLAIKKLFGHDVHSLNTRWLWVFYRKCWHLARSWLSTTVSSRRLPSRLLYHCPHRQHHPHRHSAHALQNSLSLPPKWNQEQRNHVKSQFTWTFFITMMPLVDLLSLLIYQLLFTTNYYQLVITILWLLAQF